MNKKPIELLAPAKDLATGIAAINCGADAVYIGAPRFGAREAAGNPLSDIAALIRHAHKYWAKVYVTLNTILYDSEFPAALDLISRLYDLGLDALIIQDVGLLEFDLPPIPLIASTQMHNYSLEKTVFLEQVGFQRVILARELSLEQIHRIRRQTQIELEFFVHGALCASYSGQCYLSYALGGRSGNRGNCAQPCRRLYSLADASGRILVKDRYLLSLKDLNLSAHLKELIQAGITSLKIEGRLKDRLYVMNTVSYYRQQLDAVLKELGLKKSSSGVSRSGFTPNLNKTFNRGYTTYFLHGRDSRMGFIDTPKSRGEIIGKVLTVGENDFTIDSAIHLQTGDGICFFDRDKNLKGTIINRILGKNIFPEKINSITAGTIIYRNNDKVFVRELTKNSPERKIPVLLKFTSAEDGFKLTASDEDGIQTQVSLIIEKSPARKKEQALTTIKKQLTKTGKTEFECSQLDIELDEVYFIPVAGLNMLRRQVLEKLSEVRRQKYPRSLKTFQKNNIPCPEKKLSYLGNVLNQHAAAFYHRHGVAKPDPAAESGLNMDGKKVMTLRYCIKAQLGWCRKNLKLFTPTEPLFLTDTASRYYELLFNCKRCEMELYLGKKQNS